MPSTAEYVMGIAGLTYYEQIICQWHLGDHIIRVGALQYYSFLSISLCSSLFLFSTPGIILDFIGKGLDFFTSID